MQNRLAWPLHKGDTHKSRSVNNIIWWSHGSVCIHSTHVISVANSVQVQIPSLTHPLSVSRHAPCPWSPCRRCRSPSASVSSQAAKIQEAGAASCGNARLPVGHREPSMEVDHSASQALQKSLLQHQREAPRQEAVQASEAGVPVDAVPDERTHRRPRHPRHGLLEFIWRRFVG